MVKRIVRRVIRAARTWRHEEGTAPDPTHYGIGEHTYDWVRAAFNLFADGGSDAWPAHPQ
jgi:hypothetical protein